MPGKPEEAAGEKAANEVVAMAKDVASWTRRESCNAAALFHGIRHLRRSRPESMPLWRAGIDRGLGAPEHRKFVAAASWPEAVASSAVAGGGFRLLTTLTVTDFHALWAKCLHKQTQKVGSTGRAFWLFMSHIANWRLEPLLHGRGKRH